MLILDGLNAPQGVLGVPTLDVGDGLGGDPGVPPRPPRLAAATLPTAEIGDGYPGDPGVPPKPPR